MTWRWDIVHISWWSHTGPGCSNVGCNTSAEAWLRGGGWGLRLDLYIYAHHRHYFLLQFLNGTQLFRAWITIYWMNLYTLGNLLGFAGTYLTVGDLSIGYQLPNLWKTGTWCIYHLYCTTAQCMGHFREKFILWSYLMRHLFCIYTLHLCPLLFLFLIRF